MNSESKKVSIIGAGLGGMAAGIVLASKGYNVEIFEKNQHCGGKLNCKSIDGFEFDLGPSILTLPHIFRDLFTTAGKCFDDYVKIVELSTHWRNFFEDGCVIDLVSDLNKQKDIFRDIDTGLPRQFEKFLKYSRRQYDVVNKGYFNKGIDTVAGMVYNYSPIDLWFKLDSTKLMSNQIEKYFTNSYIRDIFSFFIKYVGSSAINAPGFMNLMPWIQYGFGLWYVQGGMHAIARGMQKLLQEQGVTIHFGTEVRRINSTGKKITGLTLDDNSSVVSDYVVSNMEVIPALENLLLYNKKQLEPYKKFEPACSGLVIHLGVKKVYPQLAHHNFFYSANQKEHFKTVFDKHQLPDDPTLYIVAPTRTDQSRAPEGFDNLKILPHIPYINSENLYTENDYVVYKEKIIDKCERMGLTDLRKNIVVEDTWTPLDIKNWYNSNCGSIYGVVSDLKKNYAFKAPKKCADFDNLFFSGGSVNPGGGMPMVVLSGIKTAEAISAIDKK